MEYRRGAVAIIDKQQHSVTYKNIVNKSRTKNNYYKKLETFFQRIQVMYLSR